jgi:hypothetical protein
MITKDELSGLIQCITTIDEKGREVVSLERLERIVKDLKQRK